MNLIPLTDVSHILQAGTALPWGVRDNLGRLLLSKGHLLESDSAVKALLDRGMFIDQEEVVLTPTQPQATSDNNEDISVRWSKLESHLRLLLRSSTELYFLQRVKESISSVATLADGNTDLLIFLILRHDHARQPNYGVVHSLHAAALCSLLSRRLGWSEARRASLIGAALTMNITMLELQDQLADRGYGPTPAERMSINDHPVLAAKLLREAGLADSDWLDTVEQHHELPGGTGYPMKVSQPTEMSRMLRFVDSFTAKHSPRTGRTPLPAQKAARDLFLQSNGDPLAALVIKEFGIYPPGVCVRLASGEDAIVTQRGISANTPIVAAITNKFGEALMRPVRLDTSVATHAIVSTVPDNLVRMRCPVDALYAHCASLPTDAQNLKIKIQES